MNLFASLELGRRALFASRAALDVAGNNIANINTPGYARRRLELTETPPLYLGRFLVGSGVAAGRVVSATDRLLDAQVRSEQEGVGRHGASSGVLSQIEALLGEGSGTGISPASSGFYAAFSNLAAAADDPSLRRSAVARADGLAAAIRRQANGLAGIRKQTDQGAVDTLTQVNALTKEIADLNRRIGAEGRDAGAALDLKDARTVKLRELSGLVDISVADGARGTVSVSLAATGDTLVSEDRASALATTLDSSGLSRIQVSRAGATVDVTDRIRGGTLGGQLHVRDDLSAGYLASLDTLASDLITRVNALQALGIDGHGNPGGDLFTPTVPGTSAAATISVSAAVLADPGLLAAGTTGSAGDGANALAIASLETQASPALGGRTSASFLSELQTKLGNDSRQASSAFATARSALLAADGRLQALSGVSPDEEAAALLQYQESYEAAARFIATVNEMTKSALAIFTTP